MGLRHPVGQKYVLKHTFRVGREYMITHISSRTSTSVYTCNIVMHIAYAYTYIYVRIYTFIHTFSGGQALSYKHVTFTSMQHIHIRVYMHIHIYICTYIRTLKVGTARARVYMHTHTHTHIYSNVPGHARVSSNTECANG